MSILNAIRRRLWCFLHSQYRREEFGQIGPHCHIGVDSVLVPKNIFMDDYCIIQNKVNFISHTGKLYIKKYSVVSSGCTIIPGTHLPTVGVPFYKQAMFHIGDKDQDITINEDCWIGANSILLSGCSIGRGAIVAAGAVVTKSVPAYSVVAGCPARVIAAKFSKEDIIHHEESIYPVDERMSISDIDNLFASVLSDKIILKKEHI